MTLKTVIDTLDTFRDEYNSSTDPEVKKMCNFVSCTIDGLNRYRMFFDTSRSRIEQGQQYFSDTLETLNNLLDESNTPGTES